MELKIKNRFWLEFPENSKIPTYLVQKISPIKKTNKNWDNITITFIDNYETCKLLYNWLKEISFDGKDCLFELKLVMADKNGAAKETWLIKIEEVISIEYFVLSYTNSKLSMPKLILKPSNYIII